MGEVKTLSGPRPVVTRDQIVTVGDLQDFKKELLREIRGLLSQPKKPAQKWLKTREVRELLKISPGTLQTLRDAGTIPHCKIGGTFYYDPLEIDKEIERRKSQGRNHGEQFISLKR